MKTSHRVVDCPRPGGLEAMHLVEQSIPIPKAGEVLIEVHAAGVNRADIGQRKGVYPMPPGLSTVLGLEVAGTVAASGPQTGRYAIGDPVCALVACGGYAEYCIAREDSCLPVPPGMGMVGAAALPEALHTVWISLIEQAAMLPGETVLMHGGASGIGTMAIQIARVFGATVLATAGSPSRCKAIQELGAVLAIDYRQERFEEQIEAFLGKCRVDVILDMVGAPYAARNLSLLRQGGRLCYLNFQEGRQASFDLLEIMLRGLSITGVTLRHRSGAEKARIAAALEARVWPSLKSKAIKPVVGLTVPFIDFAKTHEALEAGEVVGKAIIVVR